MSQRIYDDIKEIVKNVVSASNPTDLIIGTIVSLNPFKVEVDGNSELYPEDCFIFPEYLTDRKVKVKFKGRFAPEGLKFQGNLKTNSFEDSVGFSGSSNSEMSTFSGNMTGSGNSEVEFVGQNNDGETIIGGVVSIKSKLHVGDKVLLFKCQEGQDILVLDRLGEWL